MFSILPCHVLTKSARQNPHEAGKADDIGRMPLKRRVQGRLKAARSSPKGR